MILKFNLFVKLKRDFFEAVGVSILLYGCTTWRQTKHIGKKLDGNNTKMLARFLEHIQVAAPQKRAAVRSFTFHLTNHSSKTNETREALM